MGFFNCMHIYFFKATNKTLSLVREAYDPKK